MVHLNNMRLQKLINNWCIWNQNRTRDEWNFVLCDGHFGRTVGLHGLRGYGKKLLAKISALDWVRVLSSLARRSLHR